MQIIMPYSSSLTKQAIMNPPISAHSLKHNREQRKHAPRMQVQFTEHSHCVLTNIMFTRPSIRIDLVIAVTQLRTEQLTLADETESALERAVG